MGSKFTVMFVSTNTWLAAEEVKVKYAYIRRQSEEGEDDASRAKWESGTNGPAQRSEQQHVQNSGQLQEQHSEPQHVRHNDDWVYLIVSPWSEEHFVKVPECPARYCAK